VNRNTILLTVVPAGIGAVGITYYVMLMRQKKVTVKVSPTDATVCQTTQTVTVTVKNGLGKAIANATGTICVYVAGEKAPDQYGNTDHPFTTDANGSWSMSLCWEKPGTGTVATTEYYPLSFVATVQGATGTGTGRIVVPAGTVLPCYCPGHQPG
jgi:hypothetical protein